MKNLLDIYLPCPYDGHKPIDIEDEYSENEINSFLMDNTYTLPISCPCCGLNGNTKNWNSMVENILHTKELIKKGFYSDEL